ncbi:hypothetical protein AT6N2_C2080 [Agrobacterium tumefaciens]|nr:hypothetical protein AT6N2_C2080 [Agrobacterium tumefaciens]
MPKPERIGINHNKRPDTNPVSGLLFFAENYLDGTRQSDGVRSGFHGIAGAAHRADDILHVRKIKRLTQASDMHVDGTLIDVDIMAPDTIEQLRTGEHPARRGHQEFQKAKLRRTETHFTAFAVNAMRLAIQFDIPAFQHRRQNLGAGPAEHGLDAGHEFRRGERLDDIIVRTRCEATNTFAFLAASRQHDDGQAFRFRPHSEPTAKLDTGYTRQHPV